MYKYALPSGYKDFERLDIQHACYSKACFKALREVKISYGQTVVDAGCGSGAMTEWLAKQVGPQGKVYAIDYDAEQLDICKYRAEKSGLSNITYLKLNFENEIDCSIHADITYCRCFIHHLQNKEIGIRNLANLTRKGGNVIVSEPINSLHWVTPDNDTYHKIFDLYMAYSKLKLFEADFGKYLLDIATKSKLFSTISIEGYQPITNDPYLKSYLFKGWEHFKEELVKFNKISEHDRDMYTKQFRDIIENPAYTFGLPSLIVMQSVVN